MAVVVSLLAGIGLAEVIGTATGQVPYKQVAAPWECDRGGWFYRDAAGRLYECSTLRLAPLQPR